MSDIYITNTKTSDGNLQTFDMSLVHDAVKKNSFIELIKLYRGVSGVGLKTAKEKIEEFSGDSWRSGTHNPRTFDLNRLIEAFKEHLVVEEPYSKEQFLNLIENGIDNMEAFHFTDMLDAVEVLCSNIRKRGGLEVIAKESNEFLRNI